MSENVDVRADANQRYEDAMERRRVVYETWESLERPLTCQGSQGQPVVHPLMVEMKDLDKLCAYLGSLIQAKQRGPAPSAQIKAKIGESPSKARQQAKKTRLRAVE